MENIESSRETNRKSGVLYRQRHPDRTKAARVAYLSVEKNQITVKAALLKWRQNNRDRERENARLYRKRHPKRQGLLRGVGTKTTQTKEKNHKIDVAPARMVPLSVSSLLVLLCLSGKAANVLTANVKARMSNGI